MINKIRYLIKPDALRIILVVSRLIHLSCFLVPASLIIDYLTSVIEIEKLLAKHDIPTFLEVFGYASVSAFAIFVFRNVTSGKLDKLIEYSLTDDVSESEIYNSSLSFSTVKEMCAILSKFISKWLSKRFAFRTMIYAIVIFCAGWVAYETFIRDESEKNERSINYNYFRGLGSADSIDENLNNFKLIFNFKHNEFDTKAFGTDELNTLHYFLNALRGCLLDSTKTVKLRIVGFASEKYDEMNKITEEIELANKRAKAIEGLIDSFKRDSIDFKPYLERVTTQTHIWGSDDYEKMISKRIFKEISLDTTKNTKENQQMLTAEYLNRRAELIIVNAGGCE